ncbi:hypothetical protein GE118_02795 [Mycoplasma sp. NEAQ87857]|uniref:MG284/MPN403 family protein n=1 Tax=Mycoplasma sp. NEAQ87857 TaxID=2683967 RepID=UPI00131940B0|nr:hypothetical protein [Mycoplasma sp. NEAQ87857]QGZ97721.1 hypothetical protein GE118_02795 [Mycoplasma sp. NEAQ87857]
MNYELDNDLTNDNETLLEKQLYVQQCKVIDEIFKTHDFYVLLLKEKLLRLKFMMKNKHDQIDLKQKQELLEEKIKGKGTLIEIVLKLMHPHTAWLIEKCYLDPETKFDGRWYLEHFSKTTFYKRKKEAVQEFVGYYFNHVL